MKWTRLACLLGLAALPLAAHGQVVISQIYTSGGNASGSLYDHDFVELYNKGATAVNLSGYALQYASAAGSSWNPDQIPSGQAHPGQAGTFSFRRPSVGWLNKATEWGPH